MVAGRFGHTDKRRSLAISYHRADCERGPATTSSRAPRFPSPSADNCAPHFVAGHTTAVRCDRRLRSVGWHQSPVESRSSFVFDGRVGAVSPNRRNHCAPTVLRILNLMEAQTQMKQVEATASSIVDITHVTVYRGGTRVFTDLSLTIPAGCHTAILGPNGGGKSTLLKLFSGELHPVSREGSSLRLFGQEGWNVWDLRKHLGVVSHDLQHQYLEYVRGEDVILSGYYASIGTYEHHIFGATQRERAGRVMQELGVVHLKERPFGRMSAGEQRRFLLGRALIHNPSALVLDEPTSGLDLQACFHYLDLVRNLM